MRYQTLESLTRSVLNNGIQYMVLQGRNQESQDNIYKLRCCFRWKITSWILSTKSLLESWHQLGALSWERKRYISQITELKILTVVQDARRSQYVTWLKMVEMKNVERRILATLVFTNNTPWDSIHWLFATILGRVYEELPRTWAPYVPGSRQNSMIASRQRLNRALLPCLINSYFGTGRQTSLSCIGISNNKKITMHKRHLLHS